MSACVCKTREREESLVHQADLSPPAAPPVNTVPYVHMQASATTNYVYVAASDPLASSTQFVEIGP